MRVSGLPLTSRLCRGAHPFPSARRLFAQRYYVTMELIEEQTLPNYKKKHYYPVRVGDLFVDRYRIISKLGYGAYSTVWLAQDEKTTKYTSIKVFVQDDRHESPVLNKIKMLQYLKKCPQEHPGSTIARLHEDEFQLAGPAGNHYCTVSAPQSSSLWHIQQFFPDGKLPKELVMESVHRLLGCLNWLHVDCNVVHTEVASQNVLAQAANNDRFEELEAKERGQPSVPLLLDHEHPVYTSRGEPRDLFDLTGQPVLTDFGSARRTTSPNRGWWMPDTYRAPEVLMGLQWGVEVDIWSLGIMTLELLEGRNLFHPIDVANKQYVLPLALAQYIGVMGPPPLRMIEQSENPVISTFFNKEGQWIAEPPIQQIDLEDWITAIPPGKEKEKFVRFMRRILTWEPAERASSGELFFDEWLMGPGVGQ